MFSAGIQSRSWAWLAAALLLALVLRCPDLALRPMHNDEAVNAIKVRDMAGPGGYRYDPNEHHGPVLYYVAFAWTKMPGGVLSETGLRSLTVMFGIGLIALLPLFAVGLGRGVLVWAGIFTAVSPAMVFYSRYFIHEMLLVFFTALALAAVWRWWCTGRKSWAILGGASAGLMQATKETFVLSLAAMLGAVLLCRCWPAGKTPQRRVGPKIVAYGLLAWLGVVVVLFSSFLTHPGGVLDAVRTYLPWLNRAAGDSPHIHPWNFYWQRLAWFHVAEGPVWTEAFILMLAMVGIFSALSGRGRTFSRPEVLRFVSFYTLLLALIYTMIAYKTPWCLLGFWHGAIILAGAGAVALWERAKLHWQKVCVGLLLISGTGQLAWQSWLAAERFPADRRNPYVYAQTSPDIYELNWTVKAIAAAAGAGLRINVIAPGHDYWPLPWYLRDLGSLGWFDEIAGVPKASLVIVAAPLAEEFASTGNYQAAGLFELRPGIFLQLFVEPELWRKHLQSAKSAGE